jgi:hypothetical protein
MVLVAGATLLVRACGPDFQPDVFIQQTGPADRAGFAKGRLGVLQGGYYIAPKAVAFRYLNGGALDAAEQAQLAKIDGERINWAHLTGDEYRAAQASEEAAAANTGSARWSEVASQFGGVGGPGQDLKLTLKQGNSTEEVDVLNCPDAAFDTAVATLKARAKTWGKDSPLLQDWLKGQEAVFSNCVSRGEVPADAPAKSSVALVQDRAYQKAAALFYAGDYEDSQKAFTAIARDTASPWSRWGDYLAARSLVRQAFFFTEPSDLYSGPATFNRDLLAQAATALNAAQKRATAPAMHHAIQAELNFVNARLEPEAQLQRLAGFVAGPKHDPDFGQHLIDLRWLLDEGKMADAPLLRWMQATGSPIGLNTPAQNGSKEGKEPAPHWNEPGQMPWLIAALMNADAPEPALLAAAAAVQESSPAYETAQFERARLLLKAGRMTEARDLTSHVLTLTRRDKEAEATNAFLGLRMETAETLDAFLADAPREMISSASEEALLATCTDAKNRGTACYGAVPDVQFNADAAAVFNQRLPLSLWVEAAHSAALPPHLRSEVGWAAWVRALVLNQPEVARSLVPVLPDPIREVLSKSQDPSGFAASLVLLHAYGLRPYLDQGVQRSASYAVSSDFRENWWCAETTRALDRYSAQPGPKPEQPAFLTAQERVEAARQVAVLDANSNGVLWLGQRVIDYVKAHPEQPVAAESLALVVRATHYGCFLNDAAAKDKTEISKEAFTLLHSRYPKSDWAVKTPYYY